MKNLQDKCVLICGGATGIGAATAQRLCEEGARIAIGDLNEEGAQALAAQLREQGGDAVAWGFDQSQEASINALVANAIDHFGRIDGLFANVANIAAVIEEGDLLTNDIALWHKTVDVNLIGTACLVKAALPQMLEQGSGTLILTSSDAAAVGEPERPAYAATKAGVNALCRHVASKWGSAGVRCNVISPGFVLTEQMDVNMTQEMKDWMLKGARSTRHGRPADIAGAVAFLLSDDCEWVNGQVWRVNGGVSFGL